LVAGNQEEAARVRQCRKHPETAASLNNLASLYQMQGLDLRAEPYCRRTLAICTEILGENNPLTAVRLHNLAVGYQLRAEYETARKHSARALAILEAIPGGNHPSTAASRNNLGMTCLALAKLEDAEQLLTQSLAARTPIPRRPGLTWAFYTQNFRIGTVRNPCCGKRRQSRRR
jgi:tetratricopeptide (TPR) repeat protein